MKTIITIVLALGLAAATATPALGRDGPTVKAKRNPTRTTGILISAIGGGVGAGILTVGMLNETCFSSEDDEACDEDRANALGTRQFGAALMGASLGVGIPLIVHSFD